MSKQIESLLEDGLRTIETELKKEFNSSYQKELDSLTSKDKALNSLIKQRDKAQEEYFKQEKIKNDLYKQYELSKQQARQLNNVVFNLEQQVRNFYPNDIELKETNYNFLYNYINFNYLNKVKLKALDTLSKTNPVINNIQSFDLLTKKFKQMMTLALNSKEKRNILLQFYAIDWDSLGVTLPMDKHIGDVEVKDGVINMGKKLLK